MRRRWIEGIRSWIGASDPCAGCPNEECLNSQRFICPNRDCVPEDEERLFSERVRSRGFRRLVPDEVTGEIREEDI